MTSAFCLGPTEDFQIKTQEWNTWSFALWPGRSWSARCRWWGAARWRCGCGTSTRGRAGEPARRRRAAPCWRRPSAGARSCSYGSTWVAWSAERSKPSAGVCGGRMLRDWLPGMGNDTLNVKARLSVKINRSNPFPLWKVERGPDRCPLYSQSHAGIGGIKGWWLQVEIWRVDYRPSCWGRVGRSERSGKTLRLPCRCTAGCLRPRTSWDACSRWREHPRCCHTAGILKM